MRTFEATPVFTIFVDLSCAVEFHWRASSDTPVNVTIPAAGWSVQYSPDPVIPVPAVAER